MRNIPFYRLQRNKEMSVRDILKLEPHENIKQIIISVHEDSPEYAKVKITLGDESPIIIDKQHAYLHGFDHLVSSNNNRDEKLDCRILALVGCAISISVNLW